MKKQSLINFGTELLSGRTDAEEILDAISENIRLVGVDIQREQALKEFDRQKKILLKKGYPEAAGMSEDEFLVYINPLRKRIEELKSFGKNLAVLIVIPEGFVSISKKLSLLEWKGKGGQNYLDISRLRNADGVEVPQVPYLLLDVEDGREMRNVSPDNCVERFKKVGRLGLTVNEGVMLVTYYPEILDDHFIDCLGSRFGSDSVPSICISAAQVGLDFSDSSFSIERWGSASCGSRIRA